MAQRLNLAFVHHRDLPQVLDFIISATNVSFNESSDIPLVELVSRLLLQQHIYFVPRCSTSQAPNTSIGFLSISSFFAASTNHRGPFILYQLLPIPFPYNHTRVRLADIPYIIGIDYTTNHLIRWTQPESTTCDFRSMTVCRETPPIITLWNDTCLFEVLTDAILSHCRIEPYHEPLFIHRVSNHWVISANSPQQCHSTSLSALNPSYVLQNNLRTLPAVALVTIPPQTNLICDRFSIASIPPLVGSALDVLDTTLINTYQTHTFDLYQHLSNSTRWPKIMYVPNDLQAVLTFLNNTPSAPTSHSFASWHRHTFSLLSILLILLTLSLLAFLLYWLFIRRPAAPSVHFDMRRIIPTVVPEPSVHLEMSSMNPTIAPASQLS